MGCAGPALPPPPAFFPAAREREEALSRRHCGAFATEDLEYRSRRRGMHGELHLHGFDDCERRARSDVIARFHQDLPYAARNGACHGARVGRQLEPGVGGGFENGRIRGPFRLTRGPPAFPLGFERLLLAALEARDVTRIRLQKLVVLAKTSFTGSSTSRSSPSPSGCASTTSF